MSRPIHIYEYTYHTVYNVSANIYKTFLSNNLILNLGLTPAGNRRKMTYRAGGTTTESRYTTPPQKVSLSLTWNFSTSRRPNVNVINNEIEYQQLAPVK